MYLFVAFDLCFLMSWNNFIHVSLVCFFFFFSENNCSCITLHAKFGRSSCLTMNASIRILHEAESSSVRSK